jgi:glycosyltransferase 2 family protein
MRNSIKVLASALLSITLVAFLFRYIKLQDIIVAISMVPAWVVLLSFFLYACSFVFRTLRFSVLLNKKIPFPELFSISCLHNMFNGILPARTGELTFVYMVSKKRERKSTAIASIIISRFFDLVSITLQFTVAVFFIGLSEPRFFYMAFILMGLIIFSVLVAFLAIRYFRYLKIKSLMKLKYYKFLINGFEKVLSQFELLDARKAFRVFILSVIIWGFNFIMAYLIITHLGVQIGIYRTVLAFTFTAIASFIPVHGIAGFGTLEAAWTVIFMFFGATRELAISSAFGFHIINILYFIVLGIAGYLFLAFASKKSLSPRLFIFRKKSE